MEAYTGFAAVYDMFMDNIPYEEWCEYLTGLLKEYGVEEGLVLDLGCGTGSLTELLAEAGYDMIGVDYSGEMLELAMDICRDHKRFSEECKKAHDAGIRLVILTEELLPTGGLANWKSPTWKTTTSRHKAGDAISQVKPETLYKAIHTMSTRYGVEFHFCHKDETGDRIMDILTDPRRGVQE